MELGLRSVMSRLRNGHEGMAQSLAIAALAPGGSVAVGSALVLDEVSTRQTVPLDLSSLASDSRFEFLMQVEYYSAGIGCMLESTGVGEIVISVVMAGGAAAGASIEEGDVLEQIEEHVIIPETGGKLSHYDLLNFILCSMPWPGKDSTNTCHDDVFIHCCGDPVTLGASVRLLTRLERCRCESGVRFDHV